MNVVFWVGTSLVLLAAIPANLIVLLYRKVPWKGRRLGRVMFAKALAIALVLDFSLVGSLVLIFHLDRPLWFETLRLVVFGLVVIALWFQYHEYKVLLEEQQDGEDLEGHSLS